MTFMIERLCDVYSADKGDHRTWRKVRGQPDGKPLGWPTRREAEVFVDILIGRASKNNVRVVEVVDA